ncbi:hypothetical protein TWF281_004514 [Arthrobotrys megalospora]
MSDEHPRPPKTNGFDEEPVWNTGGLTQTPLDTYRSELDAPHEKNIGFAGLTMSLDHWGPPANANAFRIREQINHDVEGMGTWTHHDGEDRDALDEEVDAFAGPTVAIFNPNYPHDWTEDDALGEEDVDIDPDLAGIPTATQHNDTAENLVAQALLPDQQQPFYPPQITEFPTYEPAQRNVQPPALVSEGNYAREQSYHANQLQAPTATAVTAQSRRPRPTALHTTPSSSTGSRRSKRRKYKKARARRTGSTGPDLPCRSRMTGCNAGLKNPETLKNHHASAHGPRRYIVICSRCGAGRSNGIESKAKDNMKRHQNEDHSDWLKSKPATLWKIEWEPNPDYDPAVFVESESMPVICGYDEPRTIYAEKLDGNVALSPADRKCRTFGLRAVWDDLATGVWHATVHYQ